MLVDIIETDKVEISRDHGNAVAIMTPGEAEQFAYTILDAVKEIEIARSEGREPENYWNRH